MGKPIVAACLPVGEAIDPLTFQSHILLDRTCVEAFHQILVANLPVVQARNMITAEALKSTDVTHLLWIDDDMVFRNDSLARLLAHDLPFVGGLCFDRRPPFKPVLGRFMHPQWGFDPHAMGWLYDYPKDSLIEVDATGGAFLLIKREVFEAIRERFGDGPEWQGWWNLTPEHQQAEDLSFCARVKECGFPIKVDTGIKIGHVAGQGIVVDEEFAARNRRFEAHRWNPPWSPVDARDDGAGKPPVATIVIPTYNTKPEFLRAAVMSALAQTVPVEVIIVDDGSDRPIWAHYEEIDRVLATGGPTRIITHDENRGISAALNTGIAAMKTDWFCWLSADDLLEPTKVEAQLAALVATNRKAGCHNYNVQTDNGSTVRPASVPTWRNREEQRRALANYCAINGSTVMVHRSVFAEMGGFDPNYRYGQDWEAWSRIGTRYDWHVQADILGTRREFGNLTERLEKQKGPDWTRKLVEDDMIRSRYAP